MRECLKNQIMQEDLEQMAIEMDLFDEMQDGTVFVTGSTGLIGSQIVYLLSILNRLKNKNLSIIAMVRNEEKGKKYFGHLEEQGVKLWIGDVNHPIVLEDSVDYIIHCASATSSKYFVSNPVETIKTAIDGTDHILKLASEKKVKGMVYLSSLEVYGVPDGSSEKIAEDYYGYIDPLSVRSSYSEGKRMVECLCASYAKEYDVPVKIARLSQTFGPGVNYNDGRVFAEFARCAVEKKDIVLHTMGNTVRSYCYTKDAVSAIMHILLRGNVGDAYNVTNMDTALSIREMAEMVCDTVGEKQIKVTIDIPEDLASFGYNPEMIICMDSSKLCSLGWKATTSLEEMFARMIEADFK